VEVTAHTPLVTIRVPDDPIWQILFFIVTPSHNINRVIQRLVSHFHVLAVFGLSDCVQLILRLLIVWHNFKAFLNKFLRRFDLKKFVIGIVSRRLSIIRYSLSLSVVGRVVFFGLTFFLDHYA